MKKKQREIKDPQKLIEKLGYDPELIYEIQPQGGLDFSKHSKYIETGDGYETCIHVYEYPENLDDNWLNSVMNLDGVLAIMDVATENKMTVKQNINRSIQEQESRYNLATVMTEAKDAQKRYRELERMYEEITSMGEVVKLIHIRLYVAARTLEALDLQCEKIMNHLESCNYKSAIFLNEQYYEWISMYATYEEQNTFIQKRYGQPMLCEFLAGGNPFHFTCLNDPHGTYMGTTTSTGGSVLFDYFTITKTRLSYNAAVFGLMGAGKSTFLKKLLLDQAVRGNFIRGFDVTGEFSTLIKTLGGTIISLDGGDGILNPLEILKTDENDKISFARHASKMQTIYRFLNPSASMQELILFDTLIKELYVDYGLMDKNGEATKGSFTGLSPEKYPIFSDLLDYLDKTLKNTKSRYSAIEKELEIQQRKRISDIRNVINNVVNNYGNILDGHTTIPNILDRQIVYFNIKNLANMNPQIFDAQIFNALSLCWDNCVKIGSPMKSMWEKGQIKWEDITRYLIIFDEAHRIVNTNKLAAVEQLIVFEREARKYFGGIIFASQNIRDYMPEGSDKDSISKIKTLFELTQYKFILRQDASSVQLINKVFEGQLTETEINRIPRLEKGQCILSISGDRNVEFNIEITDQEKELFEGGA